MSSCQFLVKIFTAFLRHVLYATSDKICFCHIRLPFQLVGLTEIPILHRLSVVDTIYITKPTTHK
jgi:hypothetical protein